MYILLTVNDLKIRIKRCARSRFIISDRHFTSVPTFVVSGNVIQCEITSVCFNLGKEKEKNHIRQFVPEIFLPYSLPPRQCCKTYQKIFLFVFFIAAIPKHATRTFRLTRTFKHGRFPFENRYVSRDFFENQRFV